MQNPEIELLSLINTDLKTYKAFLTLCKEEFFYYDPAKALLRFFKSRKHKFDTYTHVMLSTEFAENMLVTPDVLASLFVETTEKKETIKSRINSLLYGLERRYVIDESKKLGSELMFSKSISEVDAVKTKLMILAATGSGEEENDWDELQQQSIRASKPIKPALPPIAQWIDGYYRGDMHFFYAAAGHGKSSVVAYEASEIVKRERKVGNNITVKVCLSEMTALAFWNRILAKDLKKERAPVQLLTDDDIVYLSETYGNFLVIKDAASAEDIVKSIITDRKDMYIIDSLQFLSRNSDNPVNSVVNELNALQNAISNTGTALMIVSHLNKNKFDNFIDKMDGKYNSSILFDKCMPYDSMMSYTDVCEKLGRRNFSLLNPYSVTGNEQDKNKLFIKLTKNNHGESGQKAKMFFLASTFDFA